ncbi:hypothetical protein [Nioella ostreopsis]|uniref:hypothetical protein n=1 Tax=Nioella ostreopsis TaxID=2448479 RepID=UPI000FDAF55B|nr:hypothetical protein [Nioella ostreopsis]
MTDNIELLSISETEFSSQDEKSECMRRMRHLVAKAIEELKPARAENARAGFTAQAYDAIDAHRSGPGREQRNADERMRYRKKAEAEGRKVRVYRKDRTEEERKRRKAQTNKERYERQKAARAKDRAEVEQLLADLEIEPCAEPEISVEDLVFFGLQPSSGPATTDAQARRDYESDKRWRSRQRKKGVPEMEIEEQLAERKSKRLLSRQ